MRSSWVRLHYKSKGWRVYGRKGGERERENHSHMDKAIWRQQTLESCAATSPRMSTWVQDCWFSPAALRGVESAVSLSLQKEIWRVNKDLLMTALFWIYGQNREKYLFVVFSQFVISSRATLEYQYNTMCKMWTCVHSCALTFSSTFIILQFHLQFQSNTIGVIISIFLFVTFFPILRRLAPIILMLITSICLF